MALMTTVLEVLGILGGISSLLWASTLIESRKLGPAVMGGQPEQPGEAGAHLSVVDSVQTAA